VEQDHVLFSVASMPDYGRLSKRSLDEMVAGARVEVAPYKRDAMDFVLWKPSKPGEPAWPSPGGIAAPGRPGWHIECSAMSWKHLGETFDIHGGGIDLVFPHHENEIAQSRCSFHTPVMANTWMHNGFLQVEGAKMSKSEGNFVTIHELLETPRFGGKKWLGEVLRLNMLRTHYRQPIDWTVESLVDAQNVLFGWHNLVAKIDLRKTDVMPSEQILKSLLDDLDTSGAILALHDRAKEASRDLDSRYQLYSDLVFLGLVPDELKLAKRMADEVMKDVKLPKNPDLGTITFFLPQINDALEAKIYVTLPSSANTTTSAATAFTLITSLELPPQFQDLWLKYGPPLLSLRDRERVKQTIGIQELNSRIERRLNARKAKNFAESDRIRDELAAMGVVLKDSKDGTTWEIAR
jgi:cysteinyl-tRNA synthetase